MRDWNAKKPASTAAGTRRARKVSDTCFRETPVLKEGRRESLCERRRSGLSRARVVFYGFFSFYTSKTTVSRIAGLNEATALRQSLLDEHRADLYLTHADIRPLPRE